MGCHVPRLGCNRVRVGTEDYSREGCRHGPGHCRKCRPLNLSTTGDCSTRLRFHEQVVARGTLGPTGARRAVGASWTASAMLEHGRRHFPGRPVGRHCTTQMLEKHPNVAKHEGKQLSVVHFRASNPRCEAGRCAGCFGVESTRYILGLSKKQESLWSKSSRHHHFESNLTRLGALKTTS